MGSLSISASRHARHGLAHPRPSRVRLVGCFTAHAASDTDLHDHGRIQHVKSERHAFLLSTTTSSFPSTSRENFDDTRHQIYYSRRYEQRDDRSGVVKMSRPLKHTTRQLRWVVLGGLATWYLDVPAHVRELLSRRGEKWAT